MMRLQIAKPFWTGKQMPYPTVIGTDALVESVKSRDGTRSDLCRSSAVQPLVNAAAIRRLLPLALCAAAACAAQTHRVKSTAPVTRAVAVYEYIGDIQKPTAARLIPVSLFLGGHFEDAGTYLSQPIPLALLNGNAYELQSSGTPLGFLDIAYARNLKQNTADATTAYDEGWFGYGKFRVEKVPRTPAAPPRKGTEGSGHVYSVQDDGRPHFGSTEAKNSTDVDPAEERPEKVSLPDDGEAKGPDPDRPTLKRTATDQRGGPKEKRPKETASISQAPPDPDTDPDRPNLSHRSVAKDDGTNGVPPDPSDLHAKPATSPEIASVSGDASGLTDANSPSLHRGKPGANQKLPELEKVSKSSTAPPELKQAVAISDAASHPVHDFRYTFDNDADRAKAEAAMRDLALAVLANPALATDAPDFVKSAPPPATSTAPKAGPATTHRTPTRSGAHRNSPAAATATGNVLTDEFFSAYLLSYGAPATYVYTAHTQGSPARYVTLIAQADPDGQLQVGFRSVTDTQHLDRTPRYRLVDAVDADASNRASLLFEVRNQGSRQFALYRLLGAKPDPLFETGTTR